MLVSNLENEEGIATNGNGDDLTDEEMSPKRNLEYHKQ